MRNLLLLSSSRQDNSGYLEHGAKEIDQFLNESGADRTQPALFIPFAGISVSYDDYESMVQEALNPYNITLQSIHRVDNPEQAVKKASAILVGGGNTFHLLHQLYQYDLVGIIREQVMHGKPYIGWSAGSNIAAPSIKTTNDMPIIQPPSFHALHLVPFQINPHYLDVHPEGFHGETRQQRLEEFMIVNPDIRIVGLPEGTAAKVIKDTLTFTGGKPVFEFINGKKSTLEASSDSHAEFLIED